MRLHHDERGQTIILVALSLPLLLGFIGLATDVGALFKDKRDIQTAADAAAIAGALNYSYGYTAWQTAAYNAATSNGFNHTSSGVTVTVPLTPQWPPSNYKGKTPYVEVTITKTEPTIFLSLFGYPSVTVQARAVATNLAPGTNCVFALGGPAVPGPALTTGAASVDANQCGLLVDSSNSPPMAVAGSLTAPSVAAVGECDGGCGSGIHPPPVSGIVPYSDPLSYLPQYSCAVTGCICVSNCTNNPVTPPASCVVAATPTLFPGCYNGLAIANNTVTLNPGVYFINGSISMSGSGTLNGAGVTLIMTSGALSITATDTLNLTAPVSGSSFPGLLFYQASSDINPAVLGGNSTSTVEGVFYAPSASLTLQGNGGANFYTDLIAQSIAFTGATSFTNYAAAPNSAGGITSIALVE